MRAPELSPAKVGFCGPAGESSRMSSAGSTESRCGVHWRIFRVSSCSSCAQKTCGTIMSPRLPASRPFVVSRLSQIQAAGRHFSLNADGGRSSADRRRRARRLARFCGADRSRHFRLADYAGSSRRVHPRREIASAPRRHALDLSVLRTKKERSRMKTPRITAAIG
jgi:hypothetical protein